MENITVPKKRISNAMIKATQFEAWPVAIMLALMLGDQTSANRYAEKLVDSPAWYVPEDERTPERLAKLRKDVLSEYL